MKIKELLTLIGKRNFSLCNKYLLENKVPQPFQSFRLLFQLAVQNTKQKHMKLALVTKRRLIEKYLSKRSHHYPIQYIIGKWQFMNLQLKIKPPILIPRFETQQMIAILLQNQQFLTKVKKRQQNNKPFRFLQLGCGSGAIGLALSQYFQQRNTNYYAEMVDIEKGAVNLSKLNMARNKINQKAVDIYEDDMISLLDRNPSKYFQSFDLIISNPPYISQKEYNTTLQKQVRRFESKLALIGDEDKNKSGLFYVEKIVNTIRQKCKNSKPMVVIQYGGQDLTYLGKQIKDSVILDYYEKRRFVFLIDW